MPRGRPKGSKNKVKTYSQDKVEKEPIQKKIPKPTIQVTSKDNEQSLITMTRSILRENGDFINAAKISKAVWKSGSYESGNITKALDSLKPFVYIERV